MLDVVKAYVAKYPKKTFAELEQDFPVSLCSKGYKFIGLLCPEERHKSWDSKYKFKRYSITRPDGILTSADGIRFYVNTQWSIDGDAGNRQACKSRRLQGD